MGRSLRTALQVIQAVEMDLDAAVATSDRATPCNQLKVVEEFRPYRGLVSPADPDAHVKRRLGSHIPGAVSGLSGLSSADGGMTPKIKRFP
jgi:hypothetical protein